MSIKLKNKEVIEYIKEYYQKDNNEWFLGFSGGKDSSATLKLVYTAIKQLDSFHKKIHVVFCDTGVENPIITNYVKRLFQNLQEESNLQNLPFEYKVIYPKLSDRFFVKVIGRGYPTPTNIFRWCTKQLRVDPINRYINAKINSSIILGVRLNESEQRNRTIEKHKLKEKFHLKQNNSAKKIIFSPILYHELEEVWLTIYSTQYPESINASEIRKIYNDAESECSSIKIKNQPCGSSRFGCWTCTVVRKDKSIANQITNGYAELEELHNFRNWLYEFRDNTKFRCKFRRNGQQSLGPITLEGRKIILEKLLDIQEKSSYTLITNQEIEEIYKLWEIDKQSKTYREN